MMMEVDVPPGVEPNQYFTVQTPSGAFMQLKAPSAEQMTIGQRRLRFQVPDASGTANGTALPTLLGAEEGAAGMPTVAAWPASAIVQGYRVDPKDATLHNVPLLKGIPVDKAERKLTEIRTGGDLMKTNVPFPERRQWRDVFWIFPFLAVVGLMIAGAIIYGRQVELQGDYPLQNVVVPGVVGGAAATVAAWFYFMFVQWQPACVVWTSLLLSPTMLILGGLAVTFSGGFFMGIIMIGLGAVYLFCIFFYFKQLIPFMIKLVEVIAKVTRENKGMMVVAIVGALMGLAWSVVCGICFFGAYQTYSDELQNATSAQQYGVIFICVLIFVWGAQVAFAVCHVTYCGVFGRWYFKKPGGVTQSLKVALTTSFGSICFGSFLIAAIRAVEAVVRSARTQAQQEGSALTCIILLCLECVVSCIGDILEYFSEWAYVQCAVRGVKFTDAARITYSLCTCANIDFIIKDLLLGSVVSLGAILCGIVGGAVGAGIGYAFSSHTNSVAIGAVIGLWGGILAGAAAAGIISSGTKAILALWAEDPEPLRLSQPETHDEFQARIASRVNE
eukprot:TRINITY_DN90580_c0_g1_i1.p1 TRINITY_DN90580_c0_g1~~TRINITY_DN90580_c0_g1_i1.p1  ORF type:complete len:559 (+),score=139.09 TRINITY_DN90580_c0_g1_i1:96-1772(+)